MSYAVAVEFQAAIYSLLTGAPDLAGVDILDAVPPGGGTGTFVLLGPEEVLDASDKSGGGAEHRFIISVISDFTGFLAAKTVAAAISQALIGQTAALTSGRIVSISFLKAVAKRLEDGEARRIDLAFRARIEV
jgi:hypothetical protein